MQTGQTLADFEVDTTGGTITQENFTGLRTVLFFYPKADTPGCTVESKDFSGLHGEFLKQNTQIYGISKDKLSAQTKFKEKFAMPFDLIADTELVLCNMFDVMKEKSMYGRKYFGIERSTFIIDEVCRVQHAWLNIKVPGHADEVLAYIKSSV